MWDAKVWLFLLVPPFRATEYSRVGRLSLYNTRMSCSQRLFCEQCSLELSCAQPAQRYMVVHWILTQCLVSNTGGCFQGIVEWHSTSWSSFTYWVSDTNGFLNYMIFQTLCTFFICQLLFSDASDSILFLPGLPSWNVSLAHSWACSCHETHTPEFM